jgi:putative GTP pyrophosphokinase
MDDTTLKKLETEYISVCSVAEKLSLCIQEQVGILLAKNAISLGVPMECRVKTWPSIKEKIDRKQLQYISIKDINDLVGLRTILLFRRDVNRVCDLIEKNFTVLSKEDTSKRLTDTQFGYSSLHYSISFPENWYSIPTFCDFSGFQVEIQIRTLAQHIWAAASHSLQYKTEINVPPPIMRTIYRVSALLETVDLEFDRVLSERERYISSLNIQHLYETLNVDNLIAILNELLPESNKGDDEPYADLMGNLHDLGIKTVADLRNLIEKNLEYALQQDKEMVAQILSGDDEFAEATNMNRVRSGIYYIHVGLIRIMLKKKFGDNVINTFKKTGKKYFPE